MSAIHASITDNPDRVSCHLRLFVSAVNSLWMSNTRSSARLLRPWKEKRRNRMTFVSKMYLKYSFKVTVDVRCGRMFSRVPVCVVLHVSMIIFLYFVLSKNCML